MHCLRESQDILRKIDENLLKDFKIESFGCIENNFFLSFNYTATLKKATKL